MWQEKPTSSECVNWIQELLLEMVKYITINRPCLSKVKVIKHLHIYCVGCLDNGQQKAKPALQNFWRKVWGKVEALKLCYYVFEGTSIIVFLWLCVCVLVWGGGVYVLRLQITHCVYVFGWHVDECACVCVGDGVCLYSPSLGRSLNILKSQIHQQNKYF